jgi:hypothetical protein
MKSDEVMTRTVSRSNEHKDHVSLGHLDGRARQIGADIWTWEVLMELLPSDHKGTYSRLQPGSYFVLRTQATRNGVAYGATQRARFFKSVGERELARRKYLGSAEQRAARAEMTEVTS